MRILYLQPADSFGGAERQSLLALAQLPRFGVEAIPVVGPGQLICQLLDRAGVHNYIYSPNIPRERRGPSPPWQRLERLAEQATAWRQARRQLLGVALRHNVELIYACRATGWILAGALGTLGIPIVWRAGSQLSSLPQHLGLWLLSRLEPPEALVCNCAQVQASLGPVIRRPTTIIPNGVDLSSFSSDGAPARLRAALGLQDQPVIGIAARPAPEKGFDQLLALAAHLRRRLPTTRWLVAGDYDWREHYQRAAANQGLDQVITFLGHVDDMPDFYKSCDVALLLSRRRSIEGFPNALLEAMAMGRPVVATRSGGVAELVRHGVEGYLAEPEDGLALLCHLQRLLRDRHLRQQMGAAGLWAVRRHYSGPATVKALAEFLRKAASAGGERRGVLLPPRPDAGPFSGSPEVSSSSKVLSFLTASWRLDKQLCAPITAPRQGIARTRDELQPPF